MPMPVQLEDLRESSDLLRTVSDRVPGILKGGVRVIIAIFRI